MQRGGTYTFSVSGHQWEWLFCAFLSELFLTPRMGNAKQENNCNISLMHINMDKMYANIVTYNLLNEGSITDFKLKKMYHDF